MLLYLLMLSCAEKKKAGATGVNGVKLTRNKPYNSAATQELKKILSERFLLDMKGREWDKFKLEIKSLIDAGADPRPQPELLTTAILFADHEMAGLMLSHGMNLEFDEEWLRILVLPPSKHDNFTKEDKIKVAKLLIPELKDLESLLRISVQDRAYEIAKATLEASSNKSRIINKVWENGELKSDYFGQGGSYAGAEEVNSLLTYAIRIEDIKMIEFLLENGASTQKNVDGKTPLEIAKGLGYREHILKKLLSEK